MWSLIADAPPEVPLDFIMKGVLKTGSNAGEREELGLALIPGYKVHVYKLQYLELVQRDENMILILNYNSFIIY